MVKNIGRRVTGLTNVPLAAGRGTFVNDIELPGTTWLAFLRSPYAHARIRSIDTSAALARPGVFKVFTGARRQGRAATRSPRPGTPKRSGPRASTGTRWRRTGCAMSARPSRRSCARTATPPYAALDDIEVDYEELPSSPTRSRRSSRARRWSSPTGATTCSTTRDWVIGDPDEAFAAADRHGVAASSARTGSRASRSSRAACVASYDAVSEEAHLLGLDPEPASAADASSPRRSACRRARSASSSRSVGGAFGLKQPPFQERAAGRVASHEARPAGEVDRGARGELPGDGPLARHPVPLRRRLQ